MPVARNFVDSTVAVGAAGARICSIGVHFKNSSQHDRPVIIVELVRIEECAGKAVILRTVMAVVLVRGDRMPSESIVLGYVSRQAIVMANEQRLTITSLN